MKFVRQRHPPPTQGEMLGARCSGEGRSRVAESFGLYSRKCLEKNSQVSVKKERRRKKQPEVNFPLLPDPTRECERVEVGWRQSERGETRGQGRGGTGEDGGTRARAVAPEKTRRGREREECWKGGKSLEHLSNEKENKNGTGNTHLISFHAGLMSGKSPAPGEGEMGG